MVHKPRRGGLDASIIMHPMCGCLMHLPLSDPMVDCKTAKPRRATKWPQKPEGTEVDTKSLSITRAARKKHARSGQQARYCLSGFARSKYVGYPQVQPDFRTSLGSVDNIDSIAKAYEGKNLSGDELKSAIAEAIGESGCMRPETAQAMFVQF